MVDPKFESRDNFVINNKYDDEEVQELNREDYYDDHAGMFRKKYLTPVTIGSVGIIVIVILFVIFLSGPKDVVDSRQLQSLETKIQQLEKKLASIGVIDQALDRLGKQEEKLNLIGERFDRFNSTVTTQIDQIIKELGVLHQKSSQTPQPVKIDQKETTPNFHLVRPEETLWGISRRYGLTLDQLRSYNNIGAEATIQPGQRLKLTPN
ncbi:MAG: LysM peptidoglycan-binding domain-containing protein [Deltaproteobacteria bacterium]|jgi:LysM repeat protein|nr:LysM peptidoglycan-binding domain-containing protein [Deltaproteobacteria bacterium]